MSQVKQIEAIIRATPYFSKVDTKNNNKYCSTKAYQNLDQPVKVYYSFSEANVVKLYESSNSNKFNDGKALKFQYKLETPSLEIEIQVENFFLEIESVANLEFIRTDNLVANKINFAITGAVKGSKLIPQNYLSYTTYSKSEYLGAAIVVRYINDKKYIAEVLSDIKHQILLSLCEGNPKFNNKENELKYRSLVEDQTLSELHKECINSKDAEKHILECINKHPITREDLLASESKKAMTFLRCQAEQINKTCINLPTSLTPVDVKHLQTMFGLSTKEQDPTNFRSQFIKKYATKEFMRSYKAESEAYQGDYQKCLQKHPVKWWDVFGKDTKKAIHFLRCQVEEIRKEIPLLRFKAEQMEQSDIASSKKRFEYIRNFEASTKYEDLQHFRDLFINKQKFRNSLETKSKASVINYFDKSIENYCDDYFSKNFDQVKCLGNLMLHTVTKDQQYEKELEEIKWNKEQKIQDKKNAREKFHAKMKAQYSMHNQCPSKDADLSVIDRFMVHAYFKNNDKMPYIKYNLVTNLYKIASSDVILYNILLYGAYSSFMEALPFNPTEVHRSIFYEDRGFSAEHPENFIPVYERPMEIVFSGESLGEYSYKNDTNTKTMGYFTSSYNRVIFRSEDDNYEVDYTILFHELTHALVSKYFKNDANPYQNSKINDFWDYLGYEIGKDKEAFEKATIKVLQNVLSVLKDKFGFDFTFSSEDKSTIMGAEVAILLMSNAINKNNIYNFIEYFNKYNLDITSQYDWLSFVDVFHYVFISEDIDAVKILLKNTSVKISDNALILSVIMNKKHIFEWILNQDIEFDINYSTSEGKTALNFAKDPEIIKLLFEMGANPYDPINYQDTCIQRARLSPEMQNLQKVIKIILMPFTPAYSEFSSQNFTTITKTKADAELVARFVQILADVDNLTPKIKQIIEPYQQYWDEFIDPKLQKFFAQADDARDYCLPLIDATSLYLHIYD